MTCLLLDTHIWVWALLRLSALPPATRTAIEMAEEVFVSAVSVYEISQKLRRGTWPEMNIETLEEMIAESENGFELLPMTVEINKIAGLLQWSNRDPFDRMIAATALAHNLALATKDAAFGEIADLQLVWK